MPTLGSKGAAQKTIVADVSIASRLIQTLVALVSDDFSGESGEGVFAQMFDDLLGFAYLATLGS